MKTYDRYGNEYNERENYTTPILCRKYGFYKVEPDGLQRTMCKLPIDIEPMTGLKESISDCMYATENGQCMNLEFRVR